MKNISLEELSKRYPEVKKDVDRVTFETVKEPPSPPDGGNKKPLLLVVRDITIGLAVTFIGLWIVYLFPEVIPP